MSEATPNGRNENQDVSRLIRELETELDGVVAGLSRIRSGLARVSLAASALEHQVSAAEKPDAITVKGPPEARAWASTTSGAASPPQELPGRDYGAVVGEVKPAESGFATWGAVSDGASWPGLRVSNVEGATEKVAAAAASETVEDAAASDVGVLHEEASRSQSTAAEALGRSRALPQADFADRVPDTVDAIDNIDTVEPVVATETVEATPGVWDWKPEPGIQGTPADFVSEPAVEVAGTPDASLLAVEAAGAADPKAPLGEGDRPGLSSGWPDESLWSQSYAWPSMNPAPVEEAGDVAREPAGPRDRAEEPPGDGGSKVSDIVARVRAELEAAEQSQGVEPPEMAADRNQVEAALPGDAAAPEIEEPDDDARRDEVSRAVAEIRRQIDAGDLDSDRQDEGAGFGRPAPGRDETAPPGVSDPSDREQVEKRGGRPAFRLAAPGSIPDWSHAPMEASGPPVVVMKDAGGRVELAKVYETLSEIDCGDGAALLNYTPHSVTIGLPANVEVPSNERLAEAVAKVFGLTSHVESDGVRVTVTIGVESRRGSAA